MLGLQKAKKNQVTENDDSKKTKVAKSSFQIRTLLVCSQNWASVQELPFVIKQAGSRVDVLCSKNSFLLRNCYYDNWIPAPLVLSLYPTALKKIVHENNYDWVILCDDPLLKLMKEAAEEEEFFRKILPLRNAGSGAVLGSKIGLSLLCRKMGFPTPNFFIYERGTDLEEKLKRVKFPLLVKKDHSWGGTGIFLCNETAVLRTTLQRLNGQRLLVQEMLKGEDIGVEALYKDGDLLMYCASVVSKYQSGRFGLSARRSCFCDSTLEILLREMGRKVGINGFASCQYVYNTQEKTYCLLELDLRPQIWVAYGRFAGKNFSLAVEEFLRTKEIPENPVNAISSTDALNKEIIIYIRDLQRCLGEADFFGLFKWLVNYQNCWKFIPLYDRFLVKDTLRLTLTILGRHIKKIGSKFIFWWAKNDQAVPG